MNNEYSIAVHRWLPSLGREGWLIMCRDLLPNCNSIC